MAANRSLRTRRLFLVLVGLASAVAARVSQAQYVLPQQPPAPTATPAVSNHERMLEKLPTPWQVIWDHRPLYELRLRLRAEEDAARRHQTAPGSQGPQWRAGYGGVAPLALVPRQGGKLDDYREELNRLEGRIKNGQAADADYFMLGLIHYESRSWALAAADFDQAIRLSRTRMESHVTMRGLANLGLGKLTAAFADLNEAVRISSNVTTLNNRGVVEAMIGKTDSAMADFDAALNIRQFVTNTTVVRINVALAMSESGKQDEAIASLSKLNPGEDPASLPAYYECLGLLYERTGNYYRSLAMYDARISSKQADESNSILYIAPESDIAGLWGRAIAYHQSTKLDAAIEDYTKVIGLNAKETAAYVNRAAAYLERSDLDLAQRDLEAALKIDPNEVYALGNRALLHIRTKHPELARTDAVRCLELRKELRPQLERILGQTVLPQGDAVTTPAARPASPFFGPAAPNTNPGPFVLPPSSAEHIYRSPFELLRPAPNAAPAQAEPQRAPSAPAVPAANTNAHSAATVPQNGAERRYDAQTPEAAVAWVADACKRGDDNAVDMALAAPLGIVMHDFRVAISQTNTTMKDYQAARSARSRTPADLPGSPAVELDKAQQNRAALEKFVIKELNIVSQEPVGDSGGALRLVIRAISENGHRVTLTPKLTYYAVREGKVWRLLPESAWIAARDNDKVQELIAYCSGEIRRINGMREIGASAIKDLNSGAPVQEVDLRVLAALSTLAAKNDQASQAGYQAGGEWVQTMLQQLQFQR